MSLVPRVPHISIAAPVPPRIAQYPTEPAIASFPESPLGHYSVPAGAGMDFPNDLFSYDDQLQLVSNDGHKDTHVAFPDLYTIEDVISASEQIDHNASLDAPASPGELINAWCSWVRRTLSLAVVTKKPTLDFQPSTLTVFHFARPHAQHNAHIILQSLRSLPTMMLRRETFPWFIHPHSHSPSARHDLPEALTNCMSIAQMFASRTPETKPFLRQSIQAEHSRFTSKVCSPR